MNWQEVDNAYREAKRTFDQVDGITTSMVRLIAGRLRKVEDPWALAALKRELADFDLRSKEWRKP